MCISVSSCNVNTNNVCIMITVDIQCISVYHDVSCLLVTELLLVHAGKKIKGAPPTSAVHSKMLLLLT